MPKRVVLDRQIDGDLVIERVAYPSKRPILAPAFVVRRQSSSGTLPVLVRLVAAGKDAILREEGSEFAREIARARAMVVAPNLRCFGERFSTGADRRPAFRGQR